jgi:hypothetical protein
LTDADLRIAVTTISGALIGDEGGCPTSPSLEVDSCIPRSAAHVRSISYIKFFTAIPSGEFARLSVLTVDKSVNYHIATNANRDT